MKIVVFFFVALCLVARAATLEIVPGAYGGGKAYVSAVVDGGTERFLIDTGSALTFVKASPRFAGYTNLGPFAFKSAANVAEETETIQLGSLGIDNHLFENVKVGRAAFEHAENTLGIDVIGRQPFSLEFNRKARLQLDSPRPEMPLLTLGVSKHGVVTIPVTIAGAEVRALWDTGAGVTTVDYTLVKLEPQNFKATGKYMRGVDGAGKPLLLQAYDVNRITVGDVTFKRIRVVAADLSMLRDHVSPQIQAVIGLNAIRKAKWFFDRENRLWKCEGT